jgi:ribonuclease HI
MNFYSLFIWAFNIMSSWMPGHVYTNGNEAADVAARDNTLQGAYFFFVKMWYKTTLHQQAHFSQVTNGLG